jgi:hypothetical protein
VGRGAARGAPGYGIATRDFNVSRICLTTSSLTSASLRITSNQSTSSSPLNQHLFLNPHPPTPQPHKMRFPRVNINLKPISPLLVGVAAFFAILWLVSGLELNVVIIDH